MFQDKDQSDPKIRRLNALREAFPQSFSGESFNANQFFDELEEVLLPFLAEDLNKGLFAWSGKQGAQQLLERPFRNTLIHDQKSWHEGDHIFIQGEHLEVLKMLHKSYSNGVRMIYADLPFTKQAGFTYPDNQDDLLLASMQSNNQTEERHVDGEQAVDTLAKRYNRWLNTIYPRLYIAHKLLQDDGMIFVSADHLVIAYLRLLMDHLFGTENYIATIVWQKTPPGSATAFSPHESHEFILAYTKKFREWWPRVLPKWVEAGAPYANPDNDPRGPWTPVPIIANSLPLLGRLFGLYGSDPLTSPTGAQVKPPEGTDWTLDPEEIPKYNAENRLYWGAQGGETPVIKRFLREGFQQLILDPIWSWEQVGDPAEARQELLAHAPLKDPRNIPFRLKPTRLIRRMLEIATPPRKFDHWNNMVLDFSTAAGATAQAIIEQNQADGGHRRALIVSPPEPLPMPEGEMRTQADVTRRRLQAAIARSREKRLTYERDIFCLKMTPSYFETWQENDITYPEGYEDENEPALPPSAPLTSLAKSWTHAGVIFELALRFGYGIDFEPGGVELSSEIEALLISNDARNTFFVLFLDDHVSRQAIDELDMPEGTLIVCRREALDKSTIDYLHKMFELKLI
ncbi:MAG: site-specific DNA-methyltransferase [Anaerolineales bacterium]|nr:site-specific DNA-methyltransferase [Anaerolineales bacterium]